jgi:hypothetical protein
MNELCGDGHGWRTVVAGDVQADVHEMEGTSRGGHAVCTVCRSEYRDDVERMLLEGRGPKEVCDWLAANRYDPEICATDIIISPWDIRAHRLGKAPVPGPAPVDAAAAVRLGHDMATNTGHVNDLMSLSERMLNRIVEEFVEGRITPDLKDLKTIMEIQLRFGGVADADTDMAAITASYGIFFQTVHEIMSPEQISVFGQKISRFPIIAGLKVRSEAQERAYEDRIRAKVIAEIETGSATRMMKGSTHDGDANVHGT